MTSAPDSPPSQETTDPIRLLASAVDEGASGTLEWPSLAEAGPLVIREGKLFLRKESALSLRGATPDPPGPGSETLSGLENPAEGRLLAALAARLARPRGPGFFQKGRSVEGKLVGPLQSRPLLMEGAVAGRSETQLLAGFGGLTSRWEAARASPALQKLVSYPEPLRRLVSRLAEPASLDEILRLSQSPRVATLANLTRLRAIGLIREAAAPASKRRDPEPERGGRVDPRLLSRFQDRIATSLRDEPLDLEPEDHRNRIAALVREGGGATHYELLEIDAAASPEQVAAAFERVARVVHPSHTASLDMPGGEGVLDALFERVTHAYRTLSDPDLRRDYDAAIGSAVGGPRALSPEEREKARRRMARANYLRAREYLDREDFHYAVELMRDAVRWDEKAEYWALLGDAQKQNPKWLRQAAESFEEALRLEPGDLRHRIRLASVHEEMGDDDSAERQYRLVLERSPDQPEARAALDRIEAVRLAAKPPGLLDRVKAWLASLGSGG